MSIGRIVVLVVFPSENIGFFSFGVCFSTANQVVIVINFTNIYPARDKGIPISITFTPSTFVENIGEVFMGIQVHLFTALNQRVIEGAHFSPLRSNTEKKILSSKRSEERRVGKEC